MRTVGLIILVTFFPVFVYAGTLININTADAALLDSLPGIGPSKATAIITYRTQHGPFAGIEDIKNVSGIGDSTYAQIAPLITVGDASTPDVSNTGNTASTTQNTAASTSGSASTYTPPPSALSVAISGDSDATLEVPFRLSARVTTKSGAVDSAAQISWSFGDGSSSFGIDVEKVFHYAGTYLVTAIATDGSTKVRAELTVTVASAAARIVSVTGDGISIANDASERLDLSGWRLTSGTGFFRIPDGMTILPGASILLPSTITNLPIAFDATLAYPDGVIATRYVPPVAKVESITEQPSVPTTSYSQIQKVEPIISSKTDVQTNGKEIVAPTASTELAAVGAALPATPSPQVAAAGASNLFHSPWIFGLFGVIATAAGAFILL
jgi:competence ComEA-like helix-hairpin-helix protein